MRGRIEQDDNDNEEGSLLKTLLAVAIFVVGGIAIDKFAVSPGMPRH